MSQQQDKVSKLRNRGLQGALFWLAAVTVPLFHAPAEALGVGVIPAHAPVRVHVAPHVQLKTVTSVNRRHPNISRRVETTSPQKRHHPAARNGAKKGKTVKAPAPPA